MENNNDRFLKRMQPFGIGAQMTIKLMQNRMGITDLPHYHKDTVEGANDMAEHLIARGGFPQQSRMIRDKRKSLDRATLYSYQAALVRKCLPEGYEVMDGARPDLPVRALINPDKTKMDYDDKIISIGFEHDYHPGDVFEWCNTKTYWLITLQDYNELAYFRGEIRRCDYQIEWLDGEQKKKSYIALRGPVETKINYIQKHGISVDTPNYSLHFYMPKNEDTMKYFKRYTKFYLGEADNPDDQICWRVEATDSISTQGILEITAVEYYANETEDDVDNGLVGAFITKLQDPNKPDESDGIIGDTFIKPKKEYIYYAETSLYGHWYLGKTKVPVTMETCEIENGYPAVKIKWNTSYSGQFDIWFGDEEGPLLNFKKTIVVESLF